MPKQFSLAGFDAMPQPTDRLFFAILPDADAAAHIARLAQRLRGEYGLKGRPIAAQRLHVTLHQVGDYVGLPQDVVTMAHDTAAAVALPPFEVVFDRAASFLGGPRNRPFVLRGSDGVASLKAFQQVLGAAMTKAGLGGWPRSSYTPHLTLLYDDRCVAEHAVEAVAWTAREFILVHSLLGRTRHVALARWPLRD